VNFTDLSTGSPTSWDWTFGDGGSSQEQNPSHEYTAVNTYTVSLTVANAQGQDTETKPDYINVTESPQQDYFCTSLAIQTGNLVSGDHTDVHSSDDVWLVISAVKLGAYPATVVEYYFDTGLSSLSSLSVTLECHPTVVRQRQRPSLYNFSTGKWIRIDDRDLYSLNDETTLIEVADPQPYLSPTGQVWLSVRTGDRQRDPWDHYIDLVKISAAP